MRRILPILLAVVLILMGCTTTKRVGGGNVSPFQSLMRKGDLLVTFDCKKEPELALSLLGSEELSRRATRISAAVHDDRFPLSLERASLSALVEGDYPSFLVSIAMGSSKDFTKKDGYYQNGSSSIGSLSSKVILSTNGDFTEEKTRIGEGPVWINDETAMKLASSSLALYSLQPTSFITMDGITKNVLEKIDAVLITIDKVEGKRFLSARFTMQTEEQASTLSKLMKSGYMLNLRTNKLPYDLETLKGMFTLQGNLLTIEGMEITEQKWNDIVRSFSFSF